MAEEQELLQLENLCKQLYETADTSLRSDAEKALVAFANTPDCLNKCQLLLERGNVRNYILNYLGTRPKLVHYVLQALVQLFSRITKLGWYDVLKDEYVFRNVVTDVGKFIQSGSTQHIMIGVQLLSQLVCEMNRVSEHGLLLHSLRLAHNCLTFDFIGTSTDESSDDLCTVQIPTSWRTAFLDFSTLELFFNLYSGLPSSLSPMALSCLVQIASVRRSLFNNAERAKFLNHIVTGVKDILENPQVQGLSDPSNYHEFCRLLARLKSNYQLGELVKVDEYPQVIKLIAEFTVTSLQMWQFAPNSVHYLLSLWQRMVASVPYVKASEPHMLETYTPEVTNAYITSRLESVHVVVRDGLEDPLEDHGLISQQLEQLSTIGRCEYDKTCALLVRLFDESAQRYQELVNAGGGNSPELTIQQGRLTWLVYIIGSVIGGRVAFASTDEHDAMDGELLMNLTDSRLSQNGCEKLDLAILSFFEHITNLKFWGRSEQIISKTLQLLSDLSVGYSSVRKLVKLEAVQFMLNNHTSDHFPFLGINAGNSPMADMRCRTLFYTALGRLLMVDLGEDEERFEQFMMPLEVFDKVNNMLANADTPIKVEEAKRSLVGLARDLRGVAFAFNTKTSYMMLFDWLYPNYTPVLHRAIEIWYSEPSVTTPVLKLMAELAQNRSQRLQFDVSSPNGILLFREVSKLMVSYGISISFSMLRMALCGNYVNFGVFRLYGDDALDNALSMFVKLLLSISQSDLLDYPKLSQNYYGLLECLAQDHMTFISNLEPQVFLYILSTISEGLTALDTMVCTGCCATLDNIITYLFRRLTSKKKKNHPSAPQDSEAFLRILELHPEILQQTVLNIIMFEDCRNQWSMSRPLLGLILLNEEYFNKLRASIISSQPQDKQQTMAQCFESLMEGIERSLLTKNRDSDKNIPP
ncbi:XPO7-like protein [Mya arenaria]|uniref:XPO7-like protein n=1 Tax=Mya arenaria TaxID=6604 RepID=A0ABY7FJ74_MYAAR|nr:XPO7-like protein [Mya arenaria]